VLSLQINKFFVFSGYERSFNLKFMRFLLYLAIAFLMTVSSYNVPSLLAQTPPLKEPIKAISIIADLPWSTPGIQEPILHLTTSMITTAKIKVRNYPFLTRSANGKLWLLFSDNTVVRQNGDSWEIVPIDGAQMDQLITIAPLGDESLILLGRNGKNNVLAAVNREGNLIWRRIGLYDSEKLDLENLHGSFDSLLVDTNGQIYLPGTRIYGAVARIDSSTGATPQVIDFGEYTDSVFIRNGELFRLTSKDQVIYWVRRTIGVNSETVVLACEELQQMFSNVHGVLPDGGALIWKDKSLTWMSSTGNTIRKVTFGGIVRNGQDVFASFPIDDQTKIIHFSNNQIVEYDVLNNLPDSARLIQVNKDRYNFLVSDSKHKLQQLIHIDRATKQRGETSVSSDSLFEIEGRISIQYPIVIDSNTLLLTGTDPKGAYFVRVEFADK
jgi:hypothetical protein